MKKKLLVLSDLWGRERSQWVDYYVPLLERVFEIRFYDSCELAGVDKSDCTEKSLHTQFVQGGIDNAVSELTERENDQVDILAFSVGGVIAWKYGIESGRIGSLYCVSSTRLRHEKVRPEGEIELYFGHRDEYKPDNKWLKRMDVDYKIVHDQGHGIYMDQTFAESLSRRIIVKTRHNTTTP